MSGLLTGQPPETVWHYTSFGGLKGILAGQMRASCLPFLNDTHEFQHAIGIFVQQIQKEIATAPDHPDDLGRKQLAHRLTTLLLNHAGNDIFVSCFSVVRDDLSQWRAYGSNQGPSFSIGFNREILEQVSASFAFDLVQVEYNYETQAEEIRGLVRRCFAESNQQELNRSGPRLMPDQFANKYGPALVRDLILQAPRYKHSTFAAEQEWRLVKRQALLSGYPHVPLHFRQSGSLVVPYIEFQLHAPLNHVEAFRSGDMTNSPITHVVIGPSPHPDELGIAVRKMTDEVFLAAEIEFSRVPFRNW